MLCVGTPCLQRNPACGGSVAPRPLNFRNCGVGWRILSAGGAASWSGLIGHILAAPASEDQIALRGRAVYLARLARRAQQQTTVQLELRGDATYLVTGGLGSVGLNIAEYLAAHGAGHLVLIGRRAPSESAQQRIDALRDQYGCTFQLVSADVADSDDVTRLSDNHS